MNFSQLLDATHISDHGSRNNLLFIAPCYLTSSSQLLLAASFAATCEMRKREICPTV